MDVLFSQDPDLVLLLHKAWNLAIEREIRPHSESWASFGIYSVTISVVAEIITSPVMQLAAAVVIEVMSYIKQKAPNWKLYISSWNLMSYDSLESLVLIIREYR